MRKIKMLLGIAVAGLAITALVGAPVATAGPTADAAKKKCKAGFKKVKVKGKKKCVKVPAPAPAAVAPTPAPAAPAITLRCVDCGFYDDNGTPHSIAHDSDSLITFAGTVSPTGRGAVTVTYDEGMNGSPTTETVAVDAAGNFSKTFELDHDDQLYTNTVSASYAGLASTSLPVFVY